MGDGWKFVWSRKRKSHSWVQFCVRSGSCSYSFWCASHVNRVWVMGGSLYGRGNASRTAEFNFASDPEAAHIVFESFPPGTIMLCPLEISSDLAITCKEFTDLISEDSQVSTVYAKLRIYT
eukprot:153842_1